MALYRPLQPMAPLIALTLGSLSAVSLAQGIVTVSSHASTSTIMEIIAGIIGLTLTMWVIIAMRTTPDNDDDDDTFDNSDVITRDAHTDITTIER